MSALPSSWNVTHLGTLVDVVRGVSYKKPDATNQTGPGLTPILRATNIGEKLALDDELVFVPDRYVRPEQRLRPGDIIVATSSGSSAVVGKSAFLDRPWNGAFGTFCCVIRAKEGVDPRYLSYYLQDRPVRERWSAAARGTNINNLKVSDIESTPVPLAPFAEQCRIVAAIEEYFSRIGAGVEALQRARRNLQRMRAAVLQAAVTGRLVPPEPGDEPGEIVLKRTLVARREALTRTGRGYFEPAAPNLDGVPDLPTGWTWASLDALAEIVGGVTKDAKRELAPSLVEVPYLRVANVQRGYLDLRDVTIIRVPPERVGELRLLPGDVLFTEGGDRDKLGRGWIWEGQIDPCIHQNHIFRARLYSTQVDPRFVSLHGNTFGQAWFITAGKQTTNLASVSLTKLKQLPVPVPPPGEQRRIVAEVERQTSFIENLSRVVEMSLQRGGVLRSSVLQAAFAGRLVARDTSEEPASSLLEHIEGDRVAGDFKRQRLLRRSRR